MNKREGIMLCYPYEPKRLTKWGLGNLFEAVIVQPKLDGDRCRAIWDNNRVVLLSSEQNEINSVPHIIGGLDFFYRSSKNKPELDGELYSHGLSHQEIHSIVSRTTNLHPDHQKISFWIFDEVDEKKTQFQRLERVNTICYLINKKPIKAIPYEWCDSHESIINSMNEAMAVGFEGVVIRNPLNFYVRKRSTEIMKFKPKQRDIYRIIDVEEAISKDNEPKGILGAFVVVDDDDRVFNVGAGCLTHVEREELWQKRESLFGKALIVQYQHINPSGVPRFALAEREQPYLLEINDD